MATKKNAVEEQAAQAAEQAVTAGAETAETAGSTESPAAGAPEEERHDVQAAESAETRETSPDPKKDADTPIREASDLLSLSALAARRRVPSWQQAALCRYMGWADGKMLTDAEYGNALKQLAARHMGGGRRR
ncbi:hypothetical protein [uncultured Desulfovibrio sp.]|uniref:hypothetical protein n=1 Tax=uncultured Desulfovibrio sp. TaxID=167968 RepID=UPI00260E87BB|nr:hypothetical protein [uncultured Desulfovibrio sp.]